MEPTERGREVKQERFTLWEFEFDMKGWLRLCVFPLAKFLKNFDSTIVSIFITFNSDAYQRKEERTLQ